MHHSRREIGRLLHEQGEAFPLDDPNAFAMSKDIELANP
jgi:hypothetical protein